MKIFIIFLKVAILTVITQIGGLIYLIYSPLGIWIAKKYNNNLQAKLVKASVFATIYLLFTFLIIPPIAKRFGRVPLPYFATEYEPLQPRSIWFCLLNRTYVKPVLKEAMIQDTKILIKSSPAYQQVYVIYLDSGFPFYDDFPLLPHLSHDDGEKIDIALFYKDAKTLQNINSCPSFMGYGVSEEPRDGERNRPTECAEQGYSWYSYMRNHIVSQSNKKNFVFDEVATAAFLRILAADKRIGKILLEPHLKTRLGLSEIDKIRLHGCQAVRHDDHIHIQL